MTMTDEELCKRLREGATWDDDVAAADRIEELEDKLAKAVDAVRALRDAMRDNIVVNDEPHTVVLPDGSRHSGPVVDFLHTLLGAQISVLDAALARVKGETK